jgi:predicted  nucleic acid-binding Zn-ribbon protein
MKEIEELYLKETGDKATYRKDSSDYHTLKYVDWLERRFTALEEKVRDANTTIDDIFKVACKYADEIADLNSKVKELDKAKESSVMWMNESFRVSGLLKVEKQQNAELKRQVEELRCCGNCDHFYVDSEDIITCQNDVYPFPVKGKCDSWQSDQLAQKEREG